MRTTWECSGPGFKGWVNKTGQAILRIDWRALHDEAWKDAQVDALGGVENGGVEAFKREFELDFTTRAGKPFYPRFALHAERHAFRMMRDDAGELMLGTSPLLCGWDFGSTAALEVGQFSQDFGGGTLALFHEIAWWEQDDLDSWNIRDLCLYALGLIQYSDLEMLKREGALKWLVDWEARRELAISEERTPGYPLPWFKYPNAHVQKHGILHFCGHESRNSTALAKKEDSTWQKVWEQAGMYVPGEMFAKMDRYTLVRNLMGIAEETGRPRLLVDPVGCAVLYKGLSGGLKHARKGQAALKGQPDPASPFNHTHDAAGYIICGVNATDLIAARQQQQIAAAATQSSFVQPGSSDLPWDEVRVPWDERPI